jgi:hypothetical protein
MGLPLTAGFTSLVHLCVFVIFSVRFCPALIFDEEAGKNLTLFFGFKMFVSRHIEV